MRITLGGGCDFDRYMDFWALNEPCPSAVRNRKTIISNLIGDYVNDNTVARIASIGSGPASEVYDYAQEIENYSLEFYLYDIDEDAHTFVAEKLLDNGIIHNVHLVRKNVLRLIYRKDTSSNDKKFNVIYSLGLIDYLPDQHIIKLLDWAFDQLEDGGTVLLGNFKQNHANDNIFKYILDWNLILRDQTHLVSLAEHSKFSQHNIEIGEENSGVQIFIKILK